MKRISFFILFLFALNHLFGQEYAADRGAFIVGGAASFSSSGGELYQQMGKRTTSATIIPSVDYFVLRNFFVGATVQYSGVKEGDSRVHSIGAGPEIGYVFAKPESKILPIVSAGYLFTKNNYKVTDLYFPDSSSSEFNFAAGVIVPVQKHIGVTLGAVYRLQKLEHESGNIFALTVGINGLLFKEPKQ